MRKNYIRVMLAGALCCLFLNACSAAYAATDAETAAAKESAQETASEEKPAQVSAQEALDLLADLLNGGKGSGNAEVQKSGSDTIVMNAEKADPAESVGEPRTITVNASGTAKAVPDKAEISFGVTTQAATAEEAQKENAEKIDQVIAHLKERGVEETSIQTSSYNLYPEYDYNGKTPKITGYQVRTSLTVSDQEIEEAGDIVSECVSLGINDVDNFRFYASSYDEAYEDALKSAVSAAEKKAAVLAEASGGKLGSVLSLSEGYQNTAYRYAKANYAMTEEAAADSASGFGMAVMPGEASIEARVTVTFELR